MKQVIKTDMSSTGKMDTAVLSRLQASRIIFLICLPLLLSSILSIWIILHLLGESETKQGQVIGEAIAKQLASGVSEYLISEDRLSLTVLLNDLVEEGVFSNATIFGADNSLVATAGDTADSASPVYTAEIHYQDSIAGYVRISLEQERLFTDNSKVVFWILLMNLILMLGTGFYATRVAKLLSDSPRDDPKPIDPVAVTQFVKKESVFSLPIIRASTRFDRKVAEPEDNFDHFSILVLKIRPASVFDDLSSNIKHVVSLYKGRIKSFDDDEITLLFTQHDQHCFQAICTALVIQSLTRESGFSEYKAGMDCGTDHTEVKQARKKASYFASVARNELLVSEGVYLQESISGRAKMSEFHSSMAPDSQLYRIDRLIDTHQRLIESQARQLEGL